MQLVTLSLLLFNIENDCERSMRMNCDDRNSKRGRGIWIVILSSACSIGYWLNRMPQEVSSKKEENVGGTERESAIGRGCGKGDKERMIFCSLAVNHCRLARKSNFSWNGGGNTFTIVFSSIIIYVSFYSSFYCYYYSLHISSSKTAWNDEAFLRKSIW